MAVRVTGYGGIGEIGGNKLLLEDSDWQVLFDFGVSFGAMHQYFEEFLRPRAAMGTHDYLRTGLLPPLHGLYRPDLEVLPQTAAFWEHAARSPGYRNDVRPLALLLSHAHADHVAYLSFLQPEIRVVASASSALIAKSVQDGRGGLESEAVFVKPRSVKGAVLESDRSAAWTQRPWQILDYDRWTPGAEEFWRQGFGVKTGAWENRPAEPAEATIDGHRVRSFPVDHSIRGAHGFAVETSAGWVAYTGDIRLHGRRGETTLAFAEELGKLELALLICEGTQATSGSGATEEHVRSRAIATVRDSQGLIVADFGPRNVERLETFLDAARAAGRQLVVLEKDALLLHALHAADPTVPVPNHAAGPLVYRDPRTRTLAWQDLVHESYPGALVEPGDVRAAPSEFVLALSLFDVTRLLDLLPGAGAWIYSSSEAYNEDLVLDMQRLRHWVDLFGMRLVGGRGSGDPSDAGLHASGHASGPDLLRFISIAQPRRVMPVHLEEESLRFYSRELRKRGIEMVAPAWGEPVEVPCAPS